MALCSLALPGELLEERKLPAFAFLETKNAGPGISKRLALAAFFIGPMKTIVTNLCRPVKSGGL